MEFDIDCEQRHRADPVRIGEPQIRDVVIGTPAHHPFRLPGDFPQVVEVNGSPPAFLSREGTLKVPAFDQARIAWMPEGRPGGWMDRVQIRGPHAAGSIAHFEVVRCLSRRAAGPRRPRP